MLCEYACEIIQEWDDADDPPVVVNKGIGKRCRRHKDLSQHEALAAIKEQDRLEGRVWTHIGEIVGLGDKGIHGDDVSGGLSMADDGTLHVDLPTLQTSHKQQLRTVLAAEKIHIK